MVLKEVHPKRILMVIYAVCVLFLGVGLYFDFPLIVTGIPVALVILYSVYAVSHSTNHEYRKEMKDPTNEELIELSAPDVLVFLGIFIIGFVLIVSGYIKFAIFLAPLLIIIWDHQGTRHHILYSPKIISYIKIIAFIFIMLSFLLMYQFLGIA